MFSTDNHCNSQDDSGSNYSDSELSEDAKGSVQSDSSVSRPPRPKPKPKKKPAKKKKRLSPDEEGYEVQNYSFDIWNKKCCWLVA